uniref:Leucine-rich repeat-containing N-terminal plant-type domain-containing protein n=1 Tax=Fagus sylvatica TaxID=28930 RepID=A0A2N9J0I0_FAGSY
MNLQWLSSLPSLQQLDLSGVDLSEVSDLQLVTNKVTSLYTDLCLSYCNISFIPTTPSVNFSSLTTLDLSYNNFGNTLIPLWVFGHQNLVSLNLSSNGFQGPIPIHLRNMTSLRHLDLSHNDFNSSIPNWLYNFSHLEFLNLRMNQLQGTISSAIGNLTSAISIDLTSNELGGKVPRSLGDVCSIKEIKFSDNKWGQDISEILGSLLRCVSNGLEILELYYTELSGHLTEELGQFQNLVWLSLEANANITDAVPSLFWSMSSQFYHLNLSHNHIYGQIPNIPMALYISSTIDLSSNLFEGPLPRISSNDLLVVDGDTVDFEKASLVIKGQVREYSTNLRLVRNFRPFQELFIRRDPYLSGEIPIEVTSLQGLQSLNFSFNILTGRIPENIGDMVSLESLDFSVNQLSGHIPPSMSNLTFLSLLNLSMNHLIGRIPSSTQLQSLHGSSFIGNELCGPPLTDNCTINDAKPDTGKGRSKDSGGREVDWFYVSMAPGFVVGFWVVWGPVLVNRQWRIGYFQFLDRMGYKLSLLWGKLGSF